MIGLLFYNTTGYTQIGICWKSSTPPVEVGDAASVPVNSHSASILPTIVNNTEIHVYGNFTLDVNNAEFNGCEFVLHSGAVMFIPNPVIVSMDNSTLEGCYAMWNRINVAPQAGLIMQDCFVSDAEEAVRLLPGALGAFFNNTFDRNWISISAPNGDFEDVVWNNTFTCSSGLFTPRAGQDSWAGISVNDNVIDVSVFFGGSTVFDGLQNGIVAVESQVNCSFCDFTNIYEDPSIEPGTGTGINASFDSQISVENSNFNLVHTGVLLDRSSVNMNSTTLSNGFVGVRTTNLIDPHLVTVFDNDFTDYDRAVQVFKLGSGHVDVRDNTIISDQSGYTLIEVISNPVSSDIVRINNNSITADSVEVTGILAWQCDQAEVNGNIIDYSQGSGAFSGIIVRTSEGATVSNNDLAGIINQSGNTLGILGNRTPMMTVCCNEVNNFSTGIQYFGECDLSDFTQNTMQSNEVSFEIRQTPNASSFIGPQDFSGNEWLDLANVMNARNEGDITRSRFRVNDSNLPVHPVTEDPPQAGWFTVNLLGGHANCDQSPNCSSGGGDPISPVDQEIVLSNPQMPDGVVRYTRTLLMERIQNDPSILGNDTDVDNWYYAQAGSELEMLLGYEKDMEEDLKMTTSESTAINQSRQNLSVLRASQRQSAEDWYNGVITLSQFVTDMDQFQDDIDIEYQTLLQLYLDVHSGLMNRAATLQSSLQAENVVESISILQKESMDLILEGYIQGGTLNASELTDLEHIAQNCQFDYGQAVYWARAAMYVLDGSAYDEEYGCGEAIAPPGTNSSPYSDDLVLHPNPASDVLYLSQQLEEVQILDVQHRIVQELSNCREISIAHLPSGVYFLRAPNDEGVVSTYRFIKE